MSVCSPSRVLQGHSMYMYTLNRVSTHRHTKGLGAENIYELTTYTHWETRLHQGHRVALNKLLIKYRVCVLVLLAFSNVFSYTIKKKTHILSHTIHFSFHHYIIASLVWFFFLPLIFTTSTSYYVSRNPVQQCSCYKPLQNSPKNLPVFSRGVCVFVLSLFRQGKSWGQSGRILKPRISNCWTRCPNFTTAASTTFSRASRRLSGPRWASRRSAHLISSQLHLISALFSLLIWFCCTVHVGNVGYVTLHYRCVAILEKLSVVAVGDSGTQPTMTHDLVLAKKKILLITRFEYSASVKNYI